MEYVEKMTERVRAGGTVRCFLSTDGQIAISLMPNRRANTDGYFEYYHGSDMLDSRWSVSDQVADDIMATIGECLIEKRRQEAVARGLPVTDGHGMEAVVPPTDVVPVLAIHREYAEIGGEG